MKVLALLALVLVPLRVQAMTIIVPSIDLSSSEARAPGDGGACLAAASASERDRALLGTMIVIA